LTEIKPSSTRPPFEPVTQAIIGGRSLWTICPARACSANKAAVVPWDPSALIFLVAVFGPMVWVNDYKAISDALDHRRRHSRETATFLGTDIQDVTCCPLDDRPAQFSLTVGIVATAVASLFRRDLGRTDRLSRPARRQVQ